MARTFSVFVSGKVIGRIYQENPTDHPHQWTAEINDKRLIVALLDSCIGYIKELFNNDVEIKMNATKPVDMLRMGQIIKLRSNNIEYLAAFQAYESEGYITIVDLENDIITHIPEDNVIFATKYFIR